MLATLDYDLALFRKAFNQRIHYFRQLQEISDSVVDIELDKPLEQSLEDSEREAQGFLNKINTTRARQRYLDHLANDRGKSLGDGDSDEDENCCILCRCEFKRGFITQWY
jgi:E3 ubiquitin-protein ligase SHPRH